MPESTKTSTLTGKLTFTSLKPVDFSNCTKQQLRDYFENSYDLNDSLFMGLKDDSVFYRYPDALRLPLIFYFAHTACVYVNKLVLAGLVQPEDRPNFGFESLFETGVDEMSWDDTENHRMGGKFEWPLVKDVVEYRRQVREMITKLIEDTPLSLPITRESPWWAIVMGIEHERIHVETSSVLIRQLPASMVVKPPGWKYAPYTCGKGPGKNTLIKVDNSDVTIGKPVDFPSFGWDNEYGEWSTKVPAFEASKYLITNKEFLEFVVDGGYKERVYWSDEGWTWLQFKKATHPTFWVCEKGCKSGCGADLAGHTHCKPVIHLANGKNSYCNGHSNVDENGHQGKDEGGGLHDYKFRCVFDVVDMPWDWPAEVNYHEAKAFCAWKGPDFRLPAEVEHHVMRGQLSPPSAGTSCDIIHHEDTKANNNLRYGSSTPVNMFPSTSAGFYDVFGNIWEYVEDHFNGLPGFFIDPLYDDYSIPGFDGRHTLIMGGSWISTGNEASRFSRYAFRRHFFQHLGFRLVRSLGAESNDSVDLPVRLVTNNVFVLGVGAKENPIQIPKDKYKMIYTSSTNSQFHYETVEALNKQLWDDYSEMSNVPRTSQLIKQCLEKYCNGHGGRALHIGSSTGGLVFSVAPNFTEVLATDYCGRFIDASLRLQIGEAVSYSDPAGGDCFEAVMPASAAASKITFKQLTWLPNEVGYFDTLLFTSIGRVMNPKSWLPRFKEIVKEKGIVVITTAGQWNIDIIKAGLGNCFILLDVCKTGSDDSEALTIWRRN